MKSVQKTTEQLQKRFIRMFKCDTAEIQKYDNYFLIIGWKKNTKTERKSGRNPGQWYRNGKPIDFNFIETKVIANGKTINKLIASAKEYKRLSKINWADYFKSLCKKRKNNK